MGRADGVQCYLDGARLEVGAEVIGPEGMRFETGRAGEIPRKARIGVVFRPPGGSAHSFLVVGDVVRSDPADRRVELRWARAITLADAPDFERFLERTFGVTRAQIDEEPGEQPGTRRREYRFPRDETARAPRPRSHRGAPLRDGSAIPAEPATRISTFRPAPAVESRDVMAPARAAVTAADVQTSEEALLEVAGHACSGRILRLGPDGMLVRTNCVPHDRSLPVKVTFDIATDEGASKVACDCRVVDIDDGRITGLAGIHLHVVRVDEGPYEGLFERYVRWLQGRAAARA